MSPLSFYVLRLLEDIREEKKDFKSGGGTLAASTRRAVRPVLGNANPNDNVPNIHRGSQILDRNPLGHAEDGLYLLDELLQSLTSLVVWTREFEGAQGFEGNEELKDVLARSYNNGRGRKRGGGHTDVRRCRNRRCWI